MQHIRELTQKGDPIIRVKLPVEITAMLKKTAKKNRRRLQDQFIKSISQTFKASKFNNINDEVFQKLEKIYVQN